MENRSGLSEKLPPTPATPADMERETQRLQQKLEMLRALQSSGRRQMIFGSIVVIVMFAIFMSATYARIHGNFDADSIQSAINDRGPQVVPMATQLMIESGRSSLPTYRDEVARTMRDRGPELAAEADKRLKQLPAETGKLLEDRLDDTFNKAIIRIEPRLKQEYPGLSDDDRNLLIQDFTANQIDIQNKNVAARINEVYTNDLIQMQAVLEKFKLPDADRKGDESELEKKFLHTMVMLLDDQVDAAYALPALEAPAAVPAAAHAAHEQAPATQASMEASPR